MIERATPIFRHATHAVVISPSGRLLMLVGSEWKERPERSHKPDLPGGTVDEGESLREALLREVQEETGLELDAESLVLSYQLTLPATYEAGFWHNHYFIAKSHTEDITLSWEHERHEWLELSEFVGQSWRPSQKLVIDFLHTNGILEAYLAQNR